MVYLFTGEDNLAKGAQLQKLKQETLSLESSAFNFDTIYAKEITLKELQEKLSYLPLKSSKRMLVIKDAQLLKEELKEFLLEYAKKPYKQSVLVLDMGALDRKDGFVNRISRYSRVFRFKETIKADAFSLSRFIERRQPDYALRTLNQLLKEGEKPERILGGLRYAWERDSSHNLQTRMRLKALLDCDIQIKTGRLKPIFALERLIVGLCGAAKPSH